MSGQGDAGWFEELVPRPARGRVFAGAARVRLGDVSRRGRMRLDAIARTLQDVSADDPRDAGFEATWVVRRMALAVDRFPVYGEDLVLETWASGAGRSWAERRVSLRGDRGAALEAATLWVVVDPATGRPTTLGAAFHDVYGEAVGNRTVRARLRHGPPPVDEPARPWAVRVVDLDVLGHVNNAVAWAPVEEALARRRDLRAPLRASVEYPLAIDPDDAVAVVEQDQPGGLRLWLVGERGVHVSVELDRHAGGVPRT